MCSGKTTLGHALAKRLSMPFHDLDHHVEQKAGMSVSDIFANLGEPAFRRLEAESLAELSDGAPAVIACGGGTPCNDNAWTAMRQAGGITVWLKPENNERLVQRLLDGRACRPLIAGISTPDEMSNFARATIEKRQPHYSKADAVFDSSYLENEEEIQSSIDKFIDLLRRYGKY